jgi:hypothetical protein
LSEAGGVRIEHKRAQQRGGEEKARFLQKIATFHQFRFLFALLFFHPKKASGAPRAGRVLRDA